MLKIGYETKIVSIYLYNHMFITTTIIKVKTYSKPKTRTH